MRRPGIEPQVYTISIPTQIIFYLCAAKVPRRKLNFIRKLIK